MDELAIEAQQKMGKSIEALGSSYKTLRTGRASATLLDKVEADYYGDKLPINQIASISVPEPRQLLVKPYSGEDLKTVVAAINASDLGLNPIVDGNQIRIVI